MPFPKGKARTLPGRTGPLQGVAFAPWRPRRQTNCGGIRVGMAHYL